MKCGISVMTRYNEECPETFDGCIYWTEKGCKMKIGD